MLHTLLLGGAVVRWTGGAEVWWTGGAVLCRTAGLAFVVTGTLAAVVVGARVVGDVLGVGDVESVATDEMTALVVGVAGPLLRTPAGPHAASVSAAMPVMTATAVRLLFMPRTVGSAHRAAGAEQRRLRSGWSPP